MELVLELSRSVLTACKISSEVKRQWYDGVYAEDEGEEHSWFEKKQYHKKNNGTTYSMLILVASWEF
jgi:hypothetical protein